MKYFRSTAVWLIPLFLSPHFSLLVAIGVISRDFSWGMINDYNIILLIISFNLKLYIFAYMKRAGNLFASLKLALFSKAHYQLNQRAQRCRRKCAHVLIERTLAGIHKDLHICE